VYCGSKIGSVVVRTSNCQHCGMGWGGSSLKLKICKQPLYTAKNRKERSIATSTIESIISNEEQKEECCVTNHFNKAYYQDFEPGLETEYVELSIIGGCANFEFETNMIFEGFLKAKHEGADSLKLDWIEVRTDQKERIKCEFSTTFTNNEYFPDNCKKLS